MAEAKTRGMTAADRLTSTTEDILAEVQQLPAELIHWELGAPEHPCLVVHGRERRAA